MIEELKSRGMEKSVFLWSDDNLSNDYFWRYLSDDQRQTIADCPCYGRVCCFKGFDADSFSFNTQAAPEQFDQQFRLFARLLKTGMDIYAYATFTCDSTRDMADRMKSFVDRLQALNENLPLRTIPLEIKAFTPVQERLTCERMQSLVNQQAAIEAWQREIHERFDSSARAQSITEVALRS